MNYTNFSSIIFYIVRLMLGTSWPLYYIITQGARNLMSLRIRIKEWGQRALISLNIDQSGQPSMKLNIDRPVSSLDLNLEIYFSFASIYMVC